MIHKKYRVEKPGGPRRREHVRAHDRLVPLNKRAPIFIGFTMGSLGAKLRHHERQVFIICAKSALAADTKLRQHLKISNNLVGIVKFEAHRLQQLCGSQGEIEYLN